jgi:hypothetical protein
MDEEIGQMVAAGFKPVEPAIDHMGDPGEGVPVGRMIFRKSPENVFKRHPGCHMGIVTDIFAVVEIDEIKIPNRPVSQECAQTKHPDDKDSDGGDEGFVHRFKKMLNPVFPSSK